MNSDCEHYQRELSSAGALPRHAGAAPCLDCDTFRAVEQTLAPPRDLIASTLERLEPVLLARAERRRGIYWGLTLAGAFSFPIIVALNAAMIWMTHAALERVATAELAMVGATMLAMSLLLALSVAYGSLPLLANWSLQLRERTS
jgi:hypothetical protein